MSPLWDDVPCSPPEWMSAETALSDRECAVAEPPPPAPVEVVPPGPPVAGPVGPDLGNT
ncbi:hypothetical protein [Actinomadura sp. DC4]|uniref:hypothetical protein n=1 Tax=Actinomadura sp. DC4 TaxID=3055069 RepID=UPI0025B24062|nr:hypothetical protein [Actinomadura sp. DC4]MDN3358965.1 hypothetical protein [Actinomadura sp. DC4]